MEIIYYLQQLLFITVLNIILIVLFYQDKQKFYQKDRIILKDDLDLNKSFKNAYWESFGGFAEHDFSNLKLGDDVLNFINNIYDFPKPKLIDKDILHIHIRSGDIMEPGHRNGMVQPPCDYYCKEIEKRNWRKVIIISEDQVKSLYRIFNNEVS